MTYTCQTCKTERTSLDCGQCLAQKLVNMHDAQKKRADEAEEKLAAAIELLKELEWANDDGWCPECHEWERYPHEPGCRLAALIGKAGS